MRDQGDTRCQAEPAHLLGGEQRHFGNLPRIRIMVDVCVADKQLPVRQDQHLHRRQRMGPRTQADHALDVAQMIQVIAHRATQHRVRISATNQDRANQRRAGAHLLHGLAPGDAHPLGELVILLPDLAVPGIAQHVDRIGVLAKLQAQSKLGDARPDQFGASDEYRAGQAFIDYLLRGLQDSMIFTLGEDDLLGPVLGGGKDRLHRRGRLVDKLGQAAPIGLKVGNRPRCHAAVHCGLGNRWGYAHEQPRIERARNEKIRSKAFAGGAVGGGGDVGLLGLREVGERIDRRELHRLVDRGRTHVERAAEYEREAQ